MGRKELLKSFTFLPLCYSVIPLWNSVVVLFVTQRDTEAFALTALAAQSATELYFATVSKSG